MLFIVPFFGWFNHNHMTWLIVVTICEFLNFRDDSSQCLYLWVIDIRCPVWECCLLKVFINSLMPNDATNALFDIFYIIDSGNGLLPDGTKPLPDPLLAYQQQGSDEHVSMPLMSLLWPKVMPHSYIKSHSICLIGHLWLEGTFNNHCWSHITFSHS